MLLKEAFYQSCLKESNYFILKCKIILNNNEIIIKEKEEVEVVKPAPTPTPEPNPIK